MAAFRMWSTTARTTLCGGAPDEAQNEGRQELHQPNQAEVESRPGDLVNLPADRRPQQSETRAGKEAAYGEEEETSLAQNLGRRSFGGRARLCAQASAPEQLDPAPAVQPKQ